MAATRRPAPRGRSSSSSANNVPALDSVLLFSTNPCFKLPFRCPPSRRQLQLCSAMPIGPRGSPWKQDSERSKTRKREQQRSCPARRQSTVLAIQLSDRTILWNCGTARGRSQASRLLYSLSTFPWMISPPSSGRCRCSKTRVQLSWSRVLFEGFATHHGSWVRDRQDSCGMTAF